MKTITSTAATNTTTATNQQQRTSAVVSPHGSAGQTASGSGCVCQSVVMQLWCGLIVLIEALRMDLRLG